MKDIIQAIWFSQYERLEENPDFAKLHSVSIEFNRKFKHEVHIFHTGVYDSPQISLLELAIAAVNSQVEWGEGYKPDAINVVHRLIDSAIASSDTVNPYIFEYETFKHGEGYRTCNNIESVYAEFLSDRAMKQKDRIEITRKLLNDLNLKINPEFCYYFFDSSKYSQDYANSHYASGSIKAEKYHEFYKLPREMFDLVLSRAIELGYIKGIALELLKVAFENDITRDFDLVKDMIESESDSMALVNFQALAFRSNRLDLLNMYENKILLSDEEEITVLKKVIQSSKRKNPRFDYQSLHPKLSRESINYVMRIFDNNSFEGLIKHEIKPSFSCGATIIKKALCLGMNIEYFEQQHVLFDYDTALLIDQYRAIKGESRLFASEVGNYKKSYRPYGEEEKFGTDKKKKEQYIDSLERISEKLKHIGFSVEDIIELDLSAEYLQDVKTRVTSREKIKSHVIFDGKKRNPLPHAAHNIILGFLGDDAVLDFMVEEICEDFKNISMLKFLREETNKTLISKGFEGVYIPDIVLGLERLGDINLGLYNIASNIRKMGLTDDLKSSLKIRSLVSYLSASIIESVEVESELGYEETKEEVAELTQKVASQGASVAAEVASHEASSANASSLSKEESRVAGRLRSEVFASRGGEVSLARPPRERSLRSESSPYAAPMPMPDLARPKASPRISAIGGRRFTPASTDQLANLNSLYNPRRPDKPHGPKKQGQKEEWVGTGHAAHDDLEYVEAMGVTALSGRNDKDSGR